MTRAEYEACQARDEHGFRVAIEALTRKGLEAGLANVDYKALVADEWRRGNIDDVIDREVDRAIGEVRDESSWFKLWSIAGLAREGPGARHHGRRARLPLRAHEEGHRGDWRPGSARRSASASSSPPSTRPGPRRNACRPSSAAATARPSPASWPTAPARNTASIPPRAAPRSPPARCWSKAARAWPAPWCWWCAASSPTWPRASASAWSARSSSRLVSVVAGGVGLVLIAKDIWDFRHGVLPIIATEMKSKETKDKVREELAKSVAEQIGDSLKEIAEKTAERVVEIWLEFRRAHAKVVELADRQEDFKRFLDTVKADDLPKLDEIVGIVLASEGEAGVIKRLDDGTLHRAVTGAAAGRPRDRPRGAIARDGAAVVGGRRRQPAQGGRIRDPSPRQARRTSPRPACSGCSACRTGSPITRLASLTPAARTSLFELETGELKGARARARRHPARQPVALSDRPRQGVRPARAARRGANARPHGRARQARACAMPSSPRSDQAAAVGMMLQASSLPDPTVLLEHAQAGARRPREPVAAVGEAPRRAAGGGPAGADPAADPASG